MNRLSALAVLAVFALSTQALAVPATAGTDTVALGSARLVVQEDEAAELVYGRLAFQAGGRFETAETKGVSWVLAELLATSEVATWLQGRGGSLSATADVDELRVVFTCRAADLEQVSKRLEARLGDEDWSGSAVEAARGRLAARLGADENTAAGRAERTVDELTFGRFHEYYRRPLSSEVTKVSPSTVESFHEANLGANRLLAGVRGSASTEDLTAGMRAGLGSLREADAVEPDPVRPVGSSTRTVIYLVDVPNADRTEVRFVAHGVRRSASTTPVIEATALALSGGEGAFLENILGTRELGSLSIALDEGWYRPGSLRFSGSIENEKAGPYLEIITEVLQQYREKLEHPEVALAREYFNAAESVAMADPAVALERAVNLQTHDTRADFYDYRSNLINSLDAKTTMRVTKEFIRVRELTMVVAGPAETIQDELEYFAETVLYRTQPERQAEAVAKANAVVEALGGRKAWSRFQGAEMVGTFYVEQGREFKSRTFHNWLLADSILSRLEHETLRGYGAAVIDGTPGWSQSRLGTRGMNNRSYEEQVRRNRRWIHGLLHRIAIEDETLGLTLNEDGNLVFSDRLGEILVMVVGEDGMPQSTTWVSPTWEQTTIYEEFAEIDGLKYPKKTTVPYARREMEADLPQTIERFSPISGIEAELVERPKDS